MVTKKQGGDDDPGRCAKWKKIRRSVEQQSRYGIELWLRDWGEDDKSLTSVRWGKKCCQNVSSAVFFLSFFCTGSGWFSLPFFLTVNRGREFKMHQCLHMYGVWVWMMLVSLDCLCSEGLLGGEWCFNIAYLLIVTVFFKSLFVWVTN